MRRKHFSIALFITTLLLSYMQLCFAEKNQTGISLEQLISAEQLRPYGRVFDLVKTKNNNYALLSNEKNNIVLHTLDSNFQERMQTTVARLGGDTINTFRYAIDDSGMFLAITDMRSDSSINELDVFNVYDGSMIKLRFGHSADSDPVLKFIDRTHVLMAIRSDDLRVYDLRTNEFIAPPLDKIKDYVKNVAEKEYKTISDIFVNPRNGLWTIIFVNIKYENSEYVPTTSQVVIFNPKNGDLIKVFSPEQYEPLYNRRISYSADNKSFRILANDNDFEFYMFSGSNNLVSIIYDIDSGTIKTERLNTKLWSLKKDYFLLKNNGIFTTNNMPTEYLI